MSDAASRIELFTYTHFDPFEYVNHDAIMAANRSGFTVNLSAESYAQVDAYMDLAIAPVGVRSSWHIRSLHTQGQAGDLVSRGLQRHDV